jgi:hypothetical protein
LSGTRSSSGWSPSQNRRPAAKIRPPALRERAHGPLQDAIEESRAAYVLRYTPKGVPATGWHPITVKVTKPGNYDIGVRPGYER